MTTTALAITGDYPENFSGSRPNKRMAPFRKKILLIDDQSETSLFITLQQEGHEVIAVESVQKAWGVVWMLQPHFIVLNLTEPSRGDISTLQGCIVLAGGIPIIIAAPISGSEAIVKALERVSPVFLSFPLGPSGIGRILHELDGSDRGNEKTFLATSEK
jgi:DNA-binding NtrC family response regulator